MFGINHMMNFWPGKKQFVEYLSIFFDVIDNIEYNFGETLGYKCQMFGVFCKRKSPTYPSAGMSVGNYYSAHLTALQERAPLSSLADLTFLAKSGLRKVGIFGDQKEAAALRLLIEKNRLFEVTRFVTPDPALLGEKDSFTVKLSDLRNSEAIFVASVLSQDEYCVRLRRKGYLGPILPCFRKGLPFFDVQSSAGHVIQMKAFLPALISGKRI